MRAHIFLCMLAYHVKGCFRRSSESAVCKRSRHAGHPRSGGARDAKRGHEEEGKTKVNADKLPLHSFASLLEHLASVVRNYCRYPGTTASETFVVTTTPNAVQARALDLLDAL